VSSYGWTEEQVAAYLARFDRAAVSAANVESNPEYGSTAENVDESVHPRFRINVHSKRRRLCDPDGISAKAAIDGLVKGGLLRDDSAKYIDAVTFTQEHSQIEETVIEIWEI
jgi:hypothetical protein